MTNPEEVTRKIEPHTKAKHDILRRYLQAWFPILNMSNDNRLVYIDGFCGSGRYEDGEPGSPIIALDTAVHSPRVMRGNLEFLFIDKDKNTIDKLNQELKNMSIPKNYRVKVNWGEFHEKTTEFLDFFERSGVKLPPTFAFVDPYGFKDVPFSLIERLLKHPKCEVLINLMVDSINRWLEHPYESLTKNIVDLFGTEECLDIAQAIGDRKNNLRKLYQKQLGKVARFVRSFEMRDRKDKPIYYLFFVSNHSLGHVKMKEAMWNVNPEGEFVFSDATDPNQTFLFKPESISNLAKILQSKFGGKGSIKVKSVREFVEDETEYLEKHMKNILKELESQKKIVVAPIKSDGTTRRANSYPDEALITFV